MKIGIGSLSVVGQQSFGASISVSIGSGLVITGSTLTATVSGLEGGETVTYQWQHDGVNITGATASTYAPTIGTGGVVDLSAITCDVIVDGGDPITSNARTIAYAAGTAPAIADGQAWFSNATNATIDASASGANLTFTYALTDAPAGVTINASTGLITPTPTANTTGTATVTATDQYGRTYTDTFTFTITTLTISVDIGDDGTLEITYGDDGGDLTLDVTVTGAGAPTHFTGSYTVTEAQQTALAAGTPLALVAPLRKDSTSPIIEGSNLEWWPAFYIYDSNAGAVVETFSIRRDGVAIGGATDFTYTTVAADSATDLVARQTVTQGGGTPVNSDSIALTIPTFAAGFEPVDLFLTTEEGYWYDPSDLTTLFTDDAATTNATVGDAVAVMHDKSGNANHATQTTAANRPILRQSGSDYYLECKRTATTAKYMEVPAAAMGAASSDNTFVGGLNCIDESGVIASYVLAGGGDKGFLILYGNSNSRIRPFVFTTSGSIGDSGTIVPATANHIFSADWDRSAGALRGWVDQALDVNATGTAADKTAITTAVIGAQTTTGLSPFYGDIYDTFVIDRKLTDVERGDLETYIAGKSSVTL